MTEQEILERRARLYAQMKDVIARGDSSPDGMSAEDIAVYTRQESEMDLLDKALARARKADAVEAPATTGTATGAANTDGDFARYLRTGEVGRAMSIGVDTAGGFLVPDSFRATLIEALEDFGGIRSLAEQMTTSTGAPILMPTADETSATGEILSEMDEVEFSDMSFGAKELHVHLYSSKGVKISNLLLQDSAISIEPYVARKLGERIARLQATHWLHGDGASKPRGVVHGRDTGKDVNTTAAFTFDNLITLVHKIDPAYRRLGCVFVMNDTSLAAARKIKTGISGDNTTLWQPSMQAGEPDRILGYPVVIDQGMDNDAATGGGSHTTGVPVLFGNFREAYVVRDVSGASIVRLNERYAEFHQTAFMAFLRSGALVKNTGAYAAIERTS